MIGTSVGHYRVTARLSAGGMGVVYRAEHALLGKPAAIKLLHPELTTNRDIVDRFFKEAKATTSVRHAGIVEVFDFGYLESGHAYLVMELLDGEPLSAAIRRSRLTATTAIALVRGVCSALAAAHAKGIVHRDLKPDNIFLVPDPDSPLGMRPKLLDFGIAKLTDVGLAGSATRTGAVMGTPTYMSPEQCRGTGEVDQRADLYSLGCMLYELVAGRPPFVSQGAGELIGQHLFMQPESPRLHAPEILPELERLIMQLLAKNPAERPASALELMQRLDEVARAYGVATTGGGSFATGAMAPVAMATPMGVPSLGPPSSLPSAPPLGAMGSRPEVFAGAYGATPLPAFGAAAVGASAPDAPTMATPHALQGWPQAAAVALPGAPPKRRGSRTGIIVAVGGLFVGVGIALAVVLGGGEAGQGEPPSPGSTTPTDVPAAATTVDAGAPIAEPVVAASPDAALPPDAAIDAAPDAAVDAPVAKPPSKPPTKPPVNPPPKPKPKPKSDVPSLIEDDI